MTVIRLEVRTGANALKVGSAFDARTSFQLPFLDKIKQKWIKRS